MNFERPVVPLKPESLFRDRSLTRAKEIVEGMAEGAASRTDQFELCGCYLCMAITMDSPLSFLLTRSKEFDHSTLYGSATRALPRDVQEALNGDITPSRYLELCLGEVNNSMESSDAVRLLDRALSVAKELDLGDERGFRNSNAESAVNPQQKSLNRALMLSNYGLLAHEYARRQQDGRYSFATAIDKQLAALTLAPQSQDMRRALWKHLEAQLNERLDANFPDVTNCVKRYSELLERFAEGDDRGARLLALARACTRLHQPFQDLDQETFASYRAQAHALACEILAKAIATGFSDRDAIDNETAFDDIRTEPEFLSVLKLLPAPSENVPAEADRD